MRGQEESVLITDLLDSGYDMLDTKENIQDFAVNRGVVSPQTPS